MSGFNFGGIKANQTKKDLQVGTLESPLMYKKGSGIVPFILGEYVPGRFDKLFPQLDTWFPEIMEAYMDPKVDAVPGFKILSGLRTQHATIMKPLEDDIVNTYRRNSWDFDELKKELYDECPFVFAAGRGLYSLTRSDEVQTRFFYDIVFNKGYFYSPDIRKFVFPIDHLSSLLRKVRTNFHAKGQFDAQIIDKVVTGTDPKTIVADVYQTNFALHQMTYAYTHWFELLEELEAYNNKPPLKTEIVTDADQIAAVMNQRARSVAVDIETSGFNFVHDKIGDFTLSYDGQTGYYFPWDVIRSHEKTRAATHNLLKKKNLIGANFKFDMKFIRYDMEYRADHGSSRDWGPKEIRINDDVIQSGHVLNEQRLNSLKSNTWYYTAYGGYNRGLDEWLAAHPKVTNYLEIPDRIRIPYAGNDPCVTMQIFHEHMNQFNTIVQAVDERDLEDGSLDPAVVGSTPMYTYYKDVMMPSVNMLCDVEYKGVYIDDAVLEREGEFIDKKLTEIEKQIRAQLEEDAGMSLPPFDITSPTQLGKILENIGWPCITRNKAKVYATNDDNLLKWEHMGYKAAKLIQNYRSWAVARKTFIGNRKEGSGWWQNVKYHPEDGTYRMHANFSPMRAESGRNTCKNPNLQNIFSHGEIAKHVKAPIAPPSKDHYTASIDFDAFQLKIGAVHSQDPTLISVYSDPNSTADLHSITAHKIFGERNFEVVEVDLFDEKGKKHTVFGEQDLKVINPDKTEKTIKAKDLKHLLEKGEVQGSASISW